eukprot:scaffold268788_cov31-Tisochrysis_lutea.AAC.1
MVMLGYDNHTRSCAVRVDLLAEMSGIHSAASASHKGNARTHEVCVSGGLSAHVACEPLYTHCSNGRSGLKKTF